MKKINRDSSLLRLLSFSVDNNWVLTEIKFGLFGQLGVKHEKKCKTMQGVFRDLK